GAHILLALKAFALFHLAPLIRRYLAGTCASGLHEARLGREAFGGEVHTFSVAYKKGDLETILAISDHVIFNSFGQWQRFQPLIQEAKAQRPDLKFGLRINPRHSEGTTPIYDPCSPGSRLGIPRSAFEGQELACITGLHFHTLCEQTFEPLERTLDVVERDFGELLHQMQWINLGGGHHITRADYEVERLIQRILHLRKTYDVEVYLEPGEAIAIHTGVLVSEVLDVTYNDMNLSILDTSATCHMPDTLEMPYRANIFGAGLLSEKLHGYRLGGQSCLAGDVIGDYAFDAPLQIGQRLMFDDMAHYTMVKTTTFNGVPLPAIAVWNSTTDALTIVREFGYEDFKHRLS
ncbi:MAG: carboxynorspermidine decarboxylase, partial [Leptolyngbyaceae bacterium]|nr:carboxynorspermidine decarboxylase [Leptolyngbyaceae bacterium]